MQHLQRFPVISKVLEIAYYGLEIRCSILLSYRRKGGEFFPPFLQKVLRYFLETFNPPLPPHSCIALPTVLPVYDTYRRRLVRKYNSNHKGDTPLYPKNFWNGIKTFSDAFNPPSIIFHLLSIIIYYIDFMFWVNYEKTTTRFYLLTKNKERVDI